MRQRRPRKHDEAHLDFVRALPCLICGNNIETQAAHVKYSDARADKREVGKSEKPDDAFTVPLCGGCHRQQHDGPERGFWILAGIDPIFVALALYRISGDHEAGEQIVRNAR